MKVIILAGGWGTRLGSLTDFIPKPMVKIGKYPILWHIMKIYSHYGYNDFIICLGVKGDVIKDFFYNYDRRKHDFTIDLSKGTIEYYNQQNENWKIQSRLLFAGNIIRQPVFNELRDNKQSYRLIGELTNTDNVMNNSFWVGVYPGMNEEKIDYMINKISELFDQV